jgi:cation diffusion facilitator family transporter
MSSSDSASHPRLASPSILTNAPAPPSEGHGTGGFSISKTLHGSRAVWVALFANIAIATIKLFAGMVGRQSAMMSEAMHSYADAINSAFLLIGLQKGSRAADKTHPFGYGLETTLWAMLASVLMLVLAGWSIQVGVSRFFQPETLHNYGIAAFILTVSLFLELGAVNVAASAVLDEKDMWHPSWFKRIQLASEAVRSIASPTTRFVFYEDSLAFIGTIVALTAITLSEFGAQWGLLPQAYAHIPDATASVIIGLMLLGLAIYLFAHNSKGLTGTAASPQTEQRIRELVLSLTSVSQIHDLRTIDYGLSGIVVQMRVEVHPDIQVKDLDDLTERIRDRIQARIQNIKEVVIEVLADETYQTWEGQFFSLVAEGRNKHVLKPREETLLQNLYYFTQSVVSDVMVPRTDVECIEVTESLDALLNLVSETGHTRIPVYEDEPDQMLGAIHAKDVFTHVREGKRDIPLASLVRELDIYPENKPLSDLLEDFKRKKTQIAMVVDEHGGFAGIVTIEDLIEEIVGEILDEYDEDLPEVEQPEPTRLVLSGRTSIDELNEKYHLDIPDEEFNTVGGFVFGLLGREPQVEDTTPFEEMTFRVLSMDGHRIDRIEITADQPFVAETEADDVAPAEAESTTLPALEEPPVL